MRPSTLLALLACGAAACGDEARVGSGDVAAETVAPDTAAEIAAPDTAETVDTTAPETVADTPVPETVAETTAPETVADTSVPETETVAETTAPETVAETETTLPANVAACEVPTMKDVYPGPLPSFPYGPWTQAEGCVAQPHDVVIVLGCPSEDDGAPSDCQIKRSIIADQLYEADWSERFITTGGAVHNAHNEAAALKALLVGRGIPADAVIEEPLAQHTDENLYYSTRIMQERGWTSALVVSEDAGHLMMTALCDANCCVDLGRMTLYEWEVEPGLNVKAGH